MPSVTMYNVAVLLFVVLPLRGSPVLRYSLGIGVSVISVESE